MFEDTSHRHRIRTVGFPYDRCWMIVTEAEGRFVTQRQEPKLAVIEAHMPEAAFVGDGQAEADSAAALTLAAPGIGSIKVTGNAGSAVIKLCTTLHRHSTVQCSNVQVPLKTQATPAWKHVRCHDWKGDAIDEGDVVADWLSTFLKQRVRLVKYGGEQKSLGFVL